MKIQVLDYGYVEFVEAWGHGKDGDHEAAGRSEEMDFEVGIIEAARQSTKGSFRGWEPAACDCDYPQRRLIANENGPGGRIFAMGVEVSHRDECASKKSPGDARLLSYLFNNQHNTPFEFAGMVLEIAAPIVVFREWHRHRTQSYNERSARYGEMPNLDYLPSRERILQANAPTTNKQAAGFVPLDENKLDDDLEALMEHQERSQTLYKRLLNHGWQKETARFALGVTRYSQMRVSANLRNWLAFLTLRCDPLAQWEIRQYANAVAQIIQEKFPHTYTLWAKTGKVV